MTSEQRDAHRLMQKVLPGLIYLYDERDPQLLLKRIAEVQMAARKPSKPVYGATRGRGLSPDEAEIARVRGW
jgi:hypothetical protein